MMKKINPKEAREGILMNMNNFWGLAEKANLSNTLVAEMLDTTVSKVTLLKHGKAWPTAQEYVLAVRYAREIEHAIENGELPAKSRYYRLQKEVFDGAGG